MNDLTITTADTVKHQLPDYIADSNPKLVEFLTAYYTFLNQPGNVEYFLNNVHGLMDVDAEDNEFNRRIITYFLKLIPDQIDVDKSTLVKNLRAMLKSKGSIESYRFIMRALFDEEVSLRWMRESVFSPSNNVFLSDTYIIVKTNDNMILSLGSILHQEGTQSSGLIESCTPFLHNDDVHWVVKVSDVIGKFNYDLEVKALKNHVNRFAIEVKHYFTIENYVSQSSSTGTILFSSNTPIPNTYYTGAKIGQLGTNFSCFVSGNIDLLYSVGETLYYSVFCENVNFSLQKPNEIYFLPKSDVDLPIILKTDYVAGIVAPVISDVNIETPGQFYNVGLPVTLFENNTTHVIGEIEEVLPGGIDELKVLSSAPGFAVGDLISVKGTHLEMGEVEVTAVDGCDAECYPVMELNDIKISTPGIGYAVDDYLYHNSIVLKVTQVEQTTVVGFEIIDRGNCVDYVNDVFSPSSTGGGYGLTFYASYRIKDVRVKNAGKKYNTPVISVVGGMGTGCQINPTIGNGVITAITIANGGSGYSPNSRVSFSGVSNGSFVYSEGQAAKIKPNVQNGIVVGFTIESGGYYFKTGDIVFVDDDNATVKCVAHVSAVTNGGVIGATIIDGGSGYSQFASLSVSDIFGGSGVGAAMYPIVQDGSIVDVVVTAHGSTYTSGIITAVDYTAPQFTPNIDPDAGKIVDVKIISAGENYSISNTPFPVTIRVDDPHGFGAVLLPIVNDGEINEVRVINTGYNYTPNTRLTVVAEVGNGCTIRPRVSTKNGGIEFVDILTPGSGYVTNTQLVIYGNGNDAKLNVVVDSGITSVDVISQPKLVYSLVTEDGTNIDAETAHDLVFDAVLPKMYSMSNSLTTELGYNLLSENNDVLCESKTSPVIEIIDQVETGNMLLETTFDILTEAGDVLCWADKNAGFGAKVSPIVDPESGFITSVEVLEAGENYHNPTYTITPNYGEFSVNLKINTKRNVKRIDIENGGSDYTNAVGVIVGVGTGALVQPIVSIDGAISDITVNNTGAGFTSMPKLIVEDTGGAGEITKVGVTKHGEFFEAPFSEELSFYVKSNEIGRVSKVKLNSINVYDEDKTQTVVFPIVIMVDSPMLVIGETVTVSNTSSHTNNDLLTESGDLLLTEDEDVLQQPNLHHTIFSGRVESIDYTRKLVKLSFESNSSSVFMFMIDEDGNRYIDEAGFNFMTEQSALLSEGDTIFGQTSLQKAEVLSIFRAHGRPQKSGQLTINHRFLNKTGITNSTSLIHDNNKIQNFAYEVSTGNSINTYETILRNLVHPAGYKMFGNVVINMDISKDTPRGLNILNQSGLFRRMIELMFVLNINVSQYLKTTSVKRFSDIISYIYSIGDVAMYHNILSGEDGFICGEDGSLLIDTITRTTSGDSSLFSDFTIDEMLSDEIIPFELETSFHNRMINI
jgi:hypothetical protein